MHASWVNFIIDSKLNAIFQRFGILWCINTSHWVKFYQVCVNVSKQTCKYFCLLLIYNKLKNFLMLFLSELAGTSSTWNSNYTSKGFSYGMNSKDPTPQPTPRTGRNNNASFNDSSLWWQKCADKGGCNSCQLMFNTMEKVLKIFVLSFLCI